MPKKPIKRVSNNEKKQRKITKAHTRMFPSPSHLTRWLFFALLNTHGFYCRDQL
ncbi:hypothetical protein J813_0585 [Acinetobacter sp. 25977_10]|nr:hypothetical protein J805_1145 [Acinetobacter sp. 25977_2]EXT74397.1 hypothetical protein J813_0585 [Acinetobacter sp. 25977_10]KCY77273.1 hypothetical protein J732_1398 [Acinetobacter sp. 796380-1375]